MIDLSTDDADKYSKDNCDGHSDSDSDTIIVSTKT